VRAAEGAATGRARPGRTLVGMTAQAPEFSWRTAAVAVYGPGAIFAFGQGAVLPMIPHVAEQLHAGIALAAFIAALVTVGELIGTLPSGWMIQRFGERTSMFMAAGLTMVGSALSFFAVNPIMFACGTFILGAAGIFFQLARQSFLTSYVPLAYRARALSLLGGMYRLGITVGPFAIAGLISIGFGPTVSFVIQACAAITIIIVLLTVPDPEHNRGTTDYGAEWPEDAPPQARDGMAVTFRKNWSVLSTVGLATAAISALRQSRQMILPLWAVAIALSPDTTALVIGVAGLIDFALFYTGGWVMDRFGRMWVVMPVVIGLSAGHLLLTAVGLLTPDLLWFSIVALVLALANGLGAGVVMTLSADLAEPGNPAPFLAVWRLIAGLGGAAAPLIISAVTALISLPIAAAVVGLLGLGGAWIYGVYLPRYDPRRQQNRVADTTEDGDDAAGEARIAEA